MDTLHHLINYLEHLDQYLLALVSSYGIWTYALLFIIIFCETGLVIMPFLPGDSLLFAAGTLAAGTNNTLNIHILFITLVIASTLGNMVNYLIGRYIGSTLYRTQSKLLNRHHLEKAHAFYERHGPITIILARFIPILRTFAPFVAGVGYMSFKIFSFYNMLSAVIWIGSLLYISYFFGNIPMIKNNFSIAIVVIIVASLLPALFAFLKSKYFKST